MVFLSSCWSPVHGLSVGKSRLFSIAQVGHGSFRQWCMVIVVFASFQVVGCCSVGYGVWGR
jgi:hypothetical protein